MIENCAVDWVGRAGACAAVCWAARARAASEAAVMLTKVLRVSMRCMVAEYWLLRQGEGHQAAA